ncbi:C-type lectin domain 19 member A [Desmophyllum pertusum]|uniref:C-type lectin domain 19 member A n=1 Tax=Desmophyllum pertusum TaxID=174260 RepID=A0A9X0D9G4_9CNID|nr:C-type lectin domain 19 member A [Desmophyllum pertusum]
MQSSCYNFFSKALNWNAAKSACETLGSKLVAINSQAEQQALASKITDAQSRWIGLYRDPKDKFRWLWVDGTRPNYTYWNTEEPNSVHEECGEMLSKANYGGKWNDLMCTNSIPYICEIPIGVCPRQLGFACKVPATSFFPRR